MERGLLGFSARLYWIMSAVSGALTLLLVYGVWSAYTAPEPPITTVDGVLRAATTDKYAIKLWLVDTPVDFVVSPNVINQRRLLESRLRIGATMHLEVDSAELREALAAKGGRAFVHVRGLVFGGERYLSNDDVRRAEATERRARVYTLPFAVAITAFFVYCGLRRRSLQDAVSEASTAAPETGAKDLLALRAPFKLHARYGRRERAQVALLLLLVGGGGLAMTVPGILELQRAAEIERIWEAGGPVVEADVVQTIVHKGSTNTYRLQLEYERDGTSRTAENEFTLWFESWPIPSTVELRFLPQSDRFVSELEFRARSHVAGGGWGLVTLGALLFACGVFGAVFVHRKTRRIRELAATGVLARAELLALREFSGQFPQLELSYKLPLGEKVTEITSADFPPPLVRDGDVIVLTSHDHRISCALRVDGYPLDIPQLASA
jgi:hypothetical protein